MPKKKRAESPAPEDLCEGGRCIGVVFEDHRQPVYAVAFWPGASDEPVVAVCGSNRASVYAIVERDISLRQVYVDNDRDESFFCCAWSRRADAPLLCVAGTRGIAKIVDCADGRLDCALVGHGNAINDCCFHAVDESLLLTASKDESIRLWNARTCVCIAVFAGDRGHRDEVLAVDCHQSGSCCLSSGMDNTIKLWQLDAEHVAKACERSHTNPQPANHRPFETVFEQFPAFSTSRVHANYVDCARWVGSLILSKSTAERLCLWSPDPQRNERLPAPLLSETNDDSEPKDDVLIVHELDLPGADIWFLRFGMCSSRQYVCAGNTSGDLVIYDVDSTEQKASLTHPKMRGAVRQCAFSPDSKLVACVGDDAGLFVYELDK